ncbi:MAG: Homoaconitate hydratase/3-isopropylmalate dehydratase large subunit LeuC family protein [Candidatus Methanohalarchaeum thermophilum]|uniref:3-isopropylmalate dehydratase large subunit n=1 Tax=Methanohalarchaeum thermophilum TaxID=1903181 RepID=A0A1Q6DT95_METT1|nr:MAG: Homoaconitate hydratase/3-isopropylmalate dehydratase large subunit LeuC family protein [Candidatus Methanohalarchaeum thermophilum]
MPKTIAEKILSRASDQDLEAGDYAFADIDLAMANDITAPLAVDAFNEIAEEVWDPDKIIIPLDHQAPADSIQAADNQKKLRKFAKEQNTTFYDVGEGICHQLMLENHVKPGQLVIGADSHTCTYGALGAFATGVGSTDMGAAFASGKLWFKVPETIKVTLEGKLPDYVGPKDVILMLAGEIGASGALYQALEFTGPTIEKMSIAGRATLCNMAIEMGGKTGLVATDEKTKEYTGSNREIEPDEEADYIEEKHYDVSNLEPKIAAPHEVDNVKDISEVEGTELDQVFIGSCTNGRYQDLKKAAEILGERKFSNEVRTIIVPASRKVNKKLMEEDIIEKFMDAGAIVQSPCCGPCMGSSFGLLGEGEVGLATSNRNFKGREGSPKARVYLSSPMVAAESAIKGEITDPRKNQK